MHAAPAPLAQPPCLQALPASVGAKTAPCKHPLQQGRRTSSQAATRSCTSFSCALEPSSSPSISSMMAVPYLRCAAQCGCERSLSSPGKQSPASSLSAMSKPAVPRPANGQETVCNSLANAAHQSSAGATPVLYRLARLLALRFFLALRHLQLHQHPAKRAEDCIVAATSDTQPARWRSSMSNPGTHCVAQMC